MMLRLTLRDFLSLQGARGMAIDVLVGRVWITEDGRAADSFVEAGRSYRVGGHGLVLIGAEGPAGTAVQAAAHPAEVVVRHAGPQAIWAWLKGGIAGALADWRARRELNALPDRMLHDIGLRRDQIEGLRAGYSRMPRCNDSVW